VVVFMDEFEKIYASVKDQHGEMNTSAQDSLLSILDGAFASKFLFVLTINESQKLSNYLLNRPGRIHYKKTYDGLDEDLIVEIIDDKLENKDQKDGVLEVSRYIGNTTMDMIISLIEECNLYQDQKPKELLVDMNLEPESLRYAYKARFGEIQVDAGTIWNTPIRGAEINFEYYGILHDKSSVTEEDNGDVNEKQYRLVKIPLDEAKVKWGKDTITVTWKKWNIVYTKDAGYRYIL